jgi:putative chitinase
MALDEEGLDYEEMMLMALATIAVEAGNFNIAVREYVSRYNTTEEGKQRGHYFDKYDDRSDLGNCGAPDGMRYRGGGAVQLTGRYNFRDVGKEMGVPLEDKPELIENPIVSARALALFLRKRKMEINQALRDGDYRRARRLVNGGSHGLDAFQSTYKRGLRIIGKG